MIFEKHTTDAVESTQSKILKPHSDGWSRKVVVVVVSFNELFVQVP